MRATPNVPETQKGPNGMDYVAFDERKQEESPIQKELNYCSCGRKPSTNMQYITTMVSKQSQDRQS